MEAPPSAPPEAPPNSSSNGVARSVSFFLLFFTIRITIGIRQKMAIIAARKMYIFGKNEVVPSLFRISSAFLRTRAPIAGPIIPGIRTCEKIRMPWNIPDLPTGVYSLIAAPKTAMPLKYPHIISKEPINTGAIDVVKNNTTKPAISQIMGKVTANLKPFLSKTLPHKAVQTDASTIAGASTST